MYLDKFTDYNLFFKILYDPVSKVDVVGAGFGGGVFFEEVADFEVEVWEVGGAVVAAGGFVFAANKPPFSDI